MNEQFVRVEGHAIRILTATRPGSSLWLLLWSGLGGTAEGFLRLLREDPEHGWNVAAIDAPGHGRSDLWDTLSNEDVVSVWDGVLQFLGSPVDVVVGGHSAGAYFAVTWATRRPTCRGLVLLEGGYMNPFPDGTDLDAVFQQNAAYLDTRRFQTWEDFVAAERAVALQWDADADVMLRAQMVEVAGEIRPRILAATANQVTANLADYRVAALPLLSLPTLVVVATLPPEMAAGRAEGVSAFRERVPDLEVVNVPKAGHDLLIDNPTAISEAAWAFLSHVHPRAEPSHG
ncbi:MAG: alpha/beta fold hydrolase [Thermaerobacter sp.]|nr:alpha/beta fold hydrolase [Thermaerobacter sp.]